MKVFRSATATGLLAVLAGVAVGPTAQAADSGAARTTGTIATTVAAARALTATPLILSVPSTVVTGHSLRVTTYTRAAARVTVFVTQSGGTSARYQGVSDAVGRYVVAAPVRFDGHVSVAVAADATHAAATRTVSYRASGVMGVSMYGYYKSSGGVVYYHPTSTNQARLLLSFQPARVVTVSARLQYRTSTGWHESTSRGTFATDSAGHLVLFTRGLKSNVLYRAVMVSVSDTWNSASNVAVGTPFMFR